MRVSLEWLKDYVDIEGLGAREIADALTNAGLEVEAIEQIGAPFSGVYVGKILSIEPHPNADKLRLVNVDLGYEQHRVVCGAQNLKDQMLIPFAKEGAVVISRKDGTTFTLGRAKIRDVESAGMICSLDELGLVDRYPKGEDGIWPIEPYVKAGDLGKSLKEALNLESDTVLEVAPTANRGDLMSMMGVAREVAALFDRTVHNLEMRRPSGTLHEKTDLVVTLRDADVCRYYGGVMMRNLKIGPSPDWMARRLQAAGVRSISNVVDITNYVMLETGQPLHAFDQFKLNTSGEISVRRAREGEKMTTLDNVERNLTNDSVVVTMNGKAVALGGLMGGADTEIDDQTKHIFLESAYFPPTSSRKSAKSVGLRTEASARFERGVDIETCKVALMRAAELLKEHAGAEFVRLVESPMPTIEAPVISLRFERVEKILGIPIDRETVARILKRLGFLLQPTKETSSIRVTVPSFRQDDVTREIDLIEEVIRIYGYDKVPYTLPEKSKSVTVTLRVRLLKKIRNAVTAQGLQEVMTTSLIGEQLLEKTNFTVDRNQLVTINNSHSSEHTLMRQSLVPNLIEVAKFNQSQGTEDIWIYELGRTYFKLGKPNFKNSGVSEKLFMSGLITGSITSGDWQQKLTPDFYLLKGMLENLFNEVLQLKGAVSYVPLADSAWLHPGKAAKLMLDGKKELGVLGELHPMLQKNLKFRHPVYVFEMNVEVLYKAVKQVSANAPVIRISHYPAVKRDMAFLAPVTLGHTEILDTLRKVDEPLLRDIELFDEYKSDQLGADKRSLAYRFTFQSEEETLTDAKIEAAVGKLKDALSQHLPIQFR